MSKVNWNVLVKSRNNGVAALKILGSNINPEHPDCFMGSDLNFVNNQDYITAVPVEIAMTVADRVALREAHPEVRYIVTGVANADVENLVNSFGYIVFEPKVEESAEKSDSSYFEINGKEVDQKTFEKVVSEAVSSVISKFFF